MLFKKTTNLAADITALPAVVAAPTVHTKTVADDAAKRQVEAAKRAAAAEKEVDQAAADAEKGMARTQVVVE